MSGLLSQTAAACTARPRRTLALAVGVTIPALVLCANLGISTSRTAMVSEDNAHWQKYMAFAHEFGIPEDLVVVARGDDPAAVRAFADEVAADLAEQPDQVKAVFHRVEMSVFEDRAPYYMEDDVFEVLGKLAGSEDIAALRVATDPGAKIQAFADLLDAVPGMVTEAKDGPETEMLTRAVGGLFQSLSRFALEGERGPIQLLDRAAAIEAAIAAREEGALDADGYLTTDHGKTGIMFVRPTYTRDEMSVVVPFVQTVRDACAKAAAGHAGVEFGLTGIPASEVDELTTITRDTIMTSLLALVGVVFLFFLYFPAKRLLAFSMIPVAFGAVWTGAFIELAFGDVNLMSSIFLVILIGMGIDFSVHITSRFLEQRRAGDGHAEAARVAVTHAGRAVLTGAVTSAGAFFAVGFSGFKGIEELGFAASFGLIVTVIASLTVYPAMLTLAGDRLPDAEARNDLFRPVVRTVMKARAPIIAAALLLTPPLAYLASSTPFDFSLLNLLPEDAESAVLMQEMIDNRDLSANALAVPVANLEAARATEAKLQALSTVHSVVSAASFLPPNPDARAAHLRRMQAAARAAKAAATGAEPAPKDVGAALANLEGALERLTDLAFAGNQKAAVDHLSRSMDAVADVRDGLESDDADAVRAGVAAYTARLSALVEDVMGRVDRAVDKGPLTPEGLPVSLRERFVSPSGRFAVYAVPKESIWDRAALGRFIAEVTEVAPDVTGFPDTFYENTGLIQSGFARASAYAALAVVLLLWIDLRRFRYVLFAILPVGIGAVWMLGWMNLANIPYNLANIVGFPLIIGVGIDNGVHVLHRYLESRSIEVATVKTGGAVILSSLTTMVGFGSLAFASHRGYSSLGQILFLGVGACLLMAVTVLPSVLASVDARPASGDAPAA